MGPYLAINEKGNHTQMDMCSINHRRTLQSSYEQGSQPEYMMDLREMLGIRKSIQAEWIAMIC